MNKVFKHLKTICKHKYYVFQECKACGILWQGIIHDLSKFSPQEFITSVKYYQGYRSPIDAEKEDIGYSKAWLHHKGHNKHHWEYWTDFDKLGNIIACDIPLKYVIEMVCDWIGASKAYMGDITEMALATAVYIYYEDHRVGRHFHPETEKTILEFLHIMETYGMKAFHDEARCRLDIERKYLDKRKEG